MKKVNLSYFSNRMILNKIDIYNCWEDYLVIQKALQINNQDIVFSITSGGCNILNFLLYDPKEIIAVDYNPYQNYLLELKITAIKNLCYEDFMKLMGVKHSKNNEEIYQSIRLNLGKNARNYWDSNSYVIKKGITCIGEDNVKRFGNFLRFLKGKKTIENFFNCKTIDEQADYFYKNIFGFPWKLFIKYAYNKYIMKSTLIFNVFRDLIYRRKRLSDKEYFRYIKNIYFPNDHFKKIEYIYSQIPIKNNIFASQILLGRYINEDCFPPYLKKENYKLLNQKLNRIMIKTSSVYEALKNYPNDYISKFNFSNIFDWMDIKAFKKHLYQITRVGRNKGKYFFSTVRNDRAIPEDFRLMVSDKQYVSKLKNEDRTTMYSSFELGTIVK